MKTWSFRRPDGSLHERRFTGHGDQLGANTPEGCTPVEGSFDHMCQRYDENTDTVVDYVPPAPTDTELTTWSWGSATKRWVPNSTLKAIKLAQIALVKEGALAENEKDITVGGFVLNADAAARTNLFQKVQIAILAAQDGLTFSVDWELADGAPVTLNVNQVKAVVRAIDNRADAIRAKFKTLRSQINTASTLQDVEAVTWVFP